MLQTLIEEMNEAERIHRRHNHALDEYGRMLVLQSAGGVCLYCQSDWGHYRVCPLIGGEGLRERSTSTTTLIDLGIDFKEVLPERRREPRFDPHKHTHEQNREVIA